MILIDFRKISYEPKSSVCPQVHNLKESRDDGYGFFENEEWKILALDCEKKKEVYANEVYA